MQIKDLLPWARKEGSGELKGADRIPSPRSSAR